MKPKFYCFLIFAAFLILSISKANAQGVGNHITMSMDNCMQISPKIIQLDLMITSDGASNSDLRLDSITFGLNFDTLISPAGATFGLQVMGNYSDLIPPMGFSLLSMNRNHFKMSAKLRVTNTGYPLVYGYKYLFFRFRLTSSLNFVSGSSPHFTLQDVPSPGYYNCSAFAYIGTASSLTSFSVTGTGDGQRSVSGACALALYGCGMTVNAKPIEISCPGANDGSISITPTSGVPPFSYLWNNGSTNTSIGGLSEGYYYVNVTDSAHCGVTYAVQLKTHIPFCNYNTLVGRCFIDYNGNGVKDIGEPPLTNTMIGSTSNTRIYASQPDTQGVFINYIDTGATITAPQNILPYYILSPVQHISNFSTYHNSDTANFSLVPIPGTQDLRISIIPSRQERIGRDVIYALTFSNVGTMAMSGNIFLIKDHRLPYVSSVPNHLSMNGDSIQWSYGNLLPNEKRTINVVLHVPSPPTVNIGDLLKSSSVIEPVATDTIKKDNYSALAERPVGSMDPNDKAMMQGEQFTTTQVANGEYFTYVIRFQNTGTDTAFKVVIADTLDNNLDGSTFEMISSSHNYTVGLENKKNITWTFDNILLVDSNHNEPASHGYVAYRVKPKNSVTAGDMIKNNASIFFDYNLPVVTNTFVTSIIFPNSVPDIGKVASDIHLFPNPTNGAATIGYSLSKTSLVRIEIFNNVGQSVSLISNSELTPGKKEIVFDESKLPAGIYFVKFSIDDDAATIKLIKM